MMAEGGEGGKGANELHTTCLHYGGSVRADFPVIHSLPSLFLSYLNGRRKRPEYFGIKPAPSLILGLTDRSPHGYDRSL